MVGPRQPDTLRIRLAKTSYEPFSGHQPSASASQLEYISGALRYPRTLATDQMLPHVQRSLTSPKNIEDRSILTNEVSSIREGSFSYSSHALITQRSILAALSRSTSPAMNTPILLHCFEQACPGRIQSPLIGLRRWVGNSTRDCFPRAIPRYV